MGKPLGLRGVEDVYDIPVCNRGCTMCGGSRDEARARLTASEGLLHASFDVTRASRDPGEGVLASPLTAAS